MLNIALTLAMSQIVVASPDKTAEIRIAADGASYSIYRQGEPIVAESSMGLQLANAPDFADLEVVDVKKESRRSDIPLTATKARTARDWYNGATVTFREKTGSRRTFLVEARASNDGVAFRYLMPKTGLVLLKGEKTVYNLPKDPTCVVTEYAPAHESGWASKKVSELDRTKLYDNPVVCSSASGRTHYAIAQSGIDSYAGSGLAPIDGGLKVSVTHLPDRKDVAVESATGLTSAWRVVMMGDRAGDLIASPLIGNLATQARGDFSWVKPGKAAWDWWSGPSVGEKPSMDRYRRFIDFAAASGFPYFLIDAGWAFNAGPCCNADPKTDITRTEPAIDMPALVAYGRQKGVGLLLWAHWVHVEPRMEKILDTYKAWGINGVKVDFMNRDDQKMVQFYTRLAQQTAKRHLLLDMHGAFPPAGLARTYPNYITQEGVMGAEFNKFEKGRITPAHNVRLAYTRMLLGPMDYTPGGFRNSTPETYAAKDVFPMTRNTRGQALAQYVVFDSPLQMVSDDPSAYANAPGFEFIKEVPTNWDETKFIDGTPESHVVLARRSGKTWYVGAMTNEQPRTITIPLAFLGKGTFAANIWQDGKTANDVTHVVKSITDRDVLQIQMSGGGGAAITIRPGS